MNQSCKIYEYKTLPNLVTRLRDDLNNSDFVLLYAYNGTGKTRLSRAFKELISPKLDGLDSSELATKKILYYSSFTEDLFYWNNDLVYYSKLKIFIKDGTYTITNVITGQVSQGFYNDFNELRFLISKTYSTPMAGGVLSVSVSNFKKL